MIYVKTFGPIVFSVVTFGLVDFITSRDNCPCGKYYIHTYKVLLIGRNICLYASSPTNSPKLIDPSDQASIFKVDLVVILIGIQAIKVVKQDIEKIPMSMILFNAKVGIFPLSYAVIPPFISRFHYFLPLGF